MQAIYCISLDSMFAVLRRIWNFKLKVSIPENNAKVRASKSPTFKYEKLLKMAWWNRPAARLWVTSSFVFFIIFSLCTNAIQQSSHGAHFEIFRSQIRLTFLQRPFYRTRVVSMYATTFDEICVSLRLQHRFNGDHKESHHACYNSQNYLLD